MTASDPTAADRAAAGTPVAARPHFGERLSAVLRSTGPLCLGIDPHPGILAAWGLPDSADGARELGVRAVAAAAGSVGIVKPQVAFFERHGGAGILALEAVIAAARAAGLLVIADAKRGDIGSTVDGYAEAWLGAGSPLESDALTVVAYQGTGSLAPAVARAVAGGKGLFVLAATSNPEAAAIQSAIVSASGSARGRSVAGAILDDVEALNRGIIASGAGALAGIDGGPLGPFGVVVGATIDPAAFGLDLHAAAATPILAPGFGEQGATPEQLRERYGSAADRVVANVARGALGAGPDGLRPALDALAERFRRARDADGPAVDRPDGDAA